MQQRIANCSIAATIHRSRKLQGDAIDAPMAPDEPKTRRRRHTVEVGQGNDDEAPRKRKLKRRAAKPEEGPFWLLFLQTGTVLLIVCVCTYSIYRHFIPAVEAPAPVDDDDVSLPAPPLHEEVRGDTAAIRWEAPHAAPTPAPTPQPLHFNLTSNRIDAFVTAPRAEHHEALRRISLSLRAQFQRIYGGENAAKYLLQAGLTTFPDDDAAPAEDLPSDLKHTACRLVRAREKQRPFRFAFGGYSVTAGRGNYFHQSYPLVMETQLHTAFSVMGLELQVRNAAIGGCPSFPYGWCTDNFWHHEADVVSWDYSMNEAGGDPLGLEAYIRQILATRRPLLIVKDTDMAVARRDLLRAYREQLPDALVIHTDPAVKPFLERADRPEGFQDWRKFGSPVGAPGQALHHPAVKEHELIAWLLTMHFLNALHVMAEDDASHGSLLKCTALPVLDSLPPPVLEEARNNTQPWRSTLFGEPDEDGSWHMNPMQCRTSFEPILQGNLTSIAASGSTGENIDVMLPKSKMFYNRAWVLDLSPAEKEAKRELDIFGGLGYVESKKAYYGLYSSHVLQFHLPYEGGGPEQPAVGDKARDWFQSVVLCQVNEKRDVVGACKPENDLALSIGGVNVTDATMIDAAGSLYLGHKLCLYARVPDGAVISTREELKNALPQKNQVILPDEEKQDETIPGLEVGVWVSNMDVNKREQACSVSHVVWEHSKRVRVAEKK